MTVEGKVTATNVAGNSTGTTLINRNSYLYRGYRYDRETGLYYLNSRYYDPETGRFINADVLINTGQNVLPANMFVYCGNNPISRIDPAGQEWWHWLLGAAVVVGCAVATVATCGGFAAAAATTAAVATGTTTVGATSSIVAASAFVGSSTIYGVEVLNAVTNSSTVEEFANQGNWGTVAKTAGGGAYCGFAAYVSSDNSSAGFSQSSSNNHTENVHNDIIDLPRVGSANKTDPYHAFPDIVDNYAGDSTITPLGNASLYQLSGSLNGKYGRFE